MGEVSGTYPIKSRLIVAGKRGYVATDSIFIEVGQGLKSDSGAWYQCVQVLGVGGNAVTLLVLATEGPNRGVLFALKIFRKLSAPERREAFLKEIAFLKISNHPSVMRVFDTGLFRTGAPGKPNEYPFVVAEYLPMTLAGVMSRRSASVVEKISYSIQLLAGIDYLASQKPQVVHRDIKPQNVFLKGHSCVLGDFGLLKVLDGQQEIGREVFKESGGAGMPFYYRTPDLVDYALQKTPLTAKSDVFQLGLVLTQLFTGSNPCEPSDEILAPVVLRALPVIPGELGASTASLLKRMLTLDPATRPEARALLDGWSGLFSNAVEMATKLEGRAF